jgi:hypothetical protein
VERNRVTAALVILGVVSILGFVVFGGRFAPRPEVQIEFGSYPEVFQGMSVEIDGKPSGILQPSGSAHRTGFTVTEGPHTIRVVHPLYVSLERRVDVPAGGKPVLLVLDLQPTVDPRGQRRTAIGFQD